MVIDFLNYISIIIWNYLSGVGINTYIVVIVLEIITFVVYFIMLGLFFGFEKISSVKKIKQQITKDVIIFFIVGNIIIFLAVWVFFNDGTFLLDTSMDSQPFIRH